MNVLSIHSLDSSADKWACIAKESRIILGEFDDASLHGAVR